MQAHKRIRERQTECRKMYAAGSITTAKYVDAMTELNAELKVTEEKMYAAAEHLENLDSLKFITSTVPTVFKKIHARFPHLTFDEVIAFEKTVRTAGGSIMTHSGMFVPTYREWHRHEHCILARKSTIVSWGCCHSRGNDGQSYSKYVCDSYDKTNQYGAYDCQDIFDRKLEYDSTTGKWHRIGKPIPATPSPDLMNRDPLGCCDNPSLFSLTDETANTPSQNDEDAIADVISAIREKIDQIELEISELRRKAAHYDDFLKKLRAITE